MADLAGGGWVVEKGVGRRRVVAGRGVVFVVAGNSMAVRCLICATVFFRSRLISSIIFVVAFMAMALAEVSGISLRLVFLLLLPPTDLSS